MKKLYYLIILCSGVTLQAFYPWAISGTRQTSTFQRSYSYARKREKNSQQYNSKKTASICISLEKKAKKD